MRERESERSVVAAAEAPSLDTVFDVLSDGRRRRTLYYLHDAEDGVATISDLADWVTLLEDTSGRDAVLTSLRHVHVPKLVDAGVAEYDARSGTVRYWAPPALEEWLEHAYHKERP